MDSTLLTKKHPASDTISLEIAVNGLLGSISTTTICDWLVQQLCSIPGYQPFGFRIMAVYLCYNS
jgi:hypothetical protein